MNAAVLHAFNEPPRFEQFSEPIAEENEVIVHVRAAALKPVDKQMASGSHYAAFRELPVVCGMDGVGCLDDGTRVFFARPRSPYGSMAQPGQDLAEAFAREAGETGFDVIIDYLWGPPTEALVAALTRRDMKPASSRVRLVEVGESAGPAISLPAAALRSSRLEILGAGTGNAPASPEIWLEAVRQLMSNVATSKLRIDTERVPLREVEDAWQRDQHGRRTVIIP